MRASQGVATTTTSPAAAPSLAAPSMARGRGHWACNEPTTSAARAASRDPIVTDAPASASRSPSPRPSGPVPPRIPTCIR